MIKHLSILIITLSDRAFLGKYEDRSGPLARQFIQEKLVDKQWSPEISSLLIPDDADKLQETLIKAIEEKTDIIFTLGGTGIGPRDITPEIILSLNNVKVIPGIMENIRIKYGATIPTALLSRSIAAIAEQTLVYAIPGSVKAVEEYLIEIFKTIEHAILMMRGVDHKHANIKSQKEINVA